MALDKTLIEIPLAGGLETKLDPKVVQPGKLLTVDNGTFATGGALSKRTGYDGLSKSAINASTGATSTVSSGSAVFQYKDELIMLDGSSLYSRSDTTGKWINKGNLIPIGVNTTRYRTSMTTTRSDSYGGADTAIIGNILCQVKQGSAGGVTELIDLTNGTVLRSDVVNAGLGSSLPAVVSDGTYFYVFTITSPSSTLAMFRVDPANPTAAPVSATVVANANSTSAWDVVANPNGGCFLAYENTTPNIVVGSVSSSGVFTSGATIAEDPLKNTLAVVLSAAGHLYVCYRRNSPTDMRCFVRNTSGWAQVVAPTTIDATTDAATNLRTVGIEATPNNVTWYYDVNTAGVTGTYRNIRTASINSHGDFVAGAAFVRQGFIVSRPFTYNSKSFICIGYSSGETGNIISTQATYFILDLTNAKVWARILDGEGYNESRLSNTASSSTVFRPVHVAQYGTSQFLFTVGACYAELQAGTQQTAASAQGPIPMAALVTLDFSFKPTASVLGETLCIATGGMVCDYDGAVVVENNFHLYPEITGYATSTIGGTYSDGTYQFTCNWMWNDAKGQITRSATAVPITVVLSGGTSTQQVQLYFPTIQLTARGQPGYEVYSTQNGGSIFYGITTQNTTASSIEGTYAFTGTLSTSDITIYTTGGVLDNGSPPALRSIVRRENRLFGYASRGQVWFTKEYLVGEPPQFSPFNVKTIDYENDSETVRLAELDGRVVALSESNIQVFYGDGPDDTGGGSTFSSAQEIATDVGLATNSPVLSADNGIYFKSPKGIYLLGRDLSAQYIGAPVEGYNSLTVTSAVLVKNKQEVRFTTSTGTTLVFDYFNGMWSTHSGLSAVDACVANALYTVVQSDGTVLRENSSVFTDNSSSITVTSETPWIHLAGLQGFQRVFYLNLLGQWQSSTSINLAVYYDYSGTASETVVFPLTSGYSSGDALQIRHHLGKKCTAVKFKVWDSNQAGTKESFKLNSLQLEIGIKKGLNPAATTI